MEDRPWWSRWSLSCTEESPTSSSNTSSKDSVTDPHRFGPLESLTLEKGDDLATLDLSEGNRWGCISRAREHWRRNLLHAFGEPENGEGLCTGTEPRVGELVDGMSSSTKP